MKISAFTTTTNSIYFQFPFIESIRSFLPICDELIVVDGGSNDGTIEAIEAIDDPKIKIINTPESKWEEDWSYSRLGKNFNIGFENCTGDWVIKFDADYVVHENCYGLVNTSKNFRKDLEKAFNENKLTISFTRNNVMTADKIFVKGKKTFGVNKHRLLETKRNIGFGLDVGRWSWGFDVIVKRFEENGIWFGDLLRTNDVDAIPCLGLFNYDFVFNTYERARERRNSNHIALMRQLNYPYKHIKVEPDYSVEHAIEYTNDAYFDNYINGIVHGFQNRYKEQILIERHPLIIQDKIKAITPDLFGYNCWNKLDKSSYYN